MPILNRYKPIGTTAEVDFKTVRQVYATERSHINQVVSDTLLWESSAAFRLEQAALHGVVENYARNDHLEPTIPYEFLGISHHYEPDFLVKLSNGATPATAMSGNTSQISKHKMTMPRTLAAKINQDFIDRLAE